MELELGEKPNLKPARNREKALNLLQLCDELTFFGERQISAKELTLKLGNQTKPLGSWLRHGLIRFGSYDVAQGKSFSYRPNANFCSMLRQELGLTKQTVVQVAAKLDRKFIALPREVWPKRGNRYYPWWTNMKVKDRIELFLSQYETMYDYDIEVARPTVLLHVYDKALEQFHQVKLKFSTQHQLKTWRSLVQDKKAWRLQLAQDIGITYEEAKNIQQSVTNGGYVSTSPSNPTCQDIGEVKAFMVRQHPLYIGLRQDFLTARDILFPGVPAREVPTKLYHMYEKVEDVAMSVVDRHLRKQGQTELWYIHDGFFSSQQQNARELEQVIEAKLGMRIKLEEEVYTRARGQDGHV